MNNKRLYDVIYFECVSMHLGFIYGHMHGFQNLKYL